MIGLGLRLATSGGREGWTRLITIGAGVMIGVMLLLLAVSGLQILKTSVQIFKTTPLKSCWQCSMSYELPGDLATLPKTAMIWNRGAEVYNGKQIDRFDVASVSNAAPTIPGIDRIIQPGEYFASPAVVQLLKTAPADQLGDRFPGTLAGEIGPKGLSSPGELVIVVGHDLQQLQQRSSYNTYLTALQTEPEKRDYDPVIMVMFLVIVGGLLFAIWSLVTAATRLGAARREEKFATLRLFGATPRQIMGIAAVDSALGAAIGAVAAIGLFYLLQPWLGKSLSRIVDVYPEEFTPGFLGVVVVVVGVLLVSILSAIFSLRRVRLSPLGVSRKTTPRPPGAWRILPLLVGLGVILFVWLTNKDLDDTLQKAELTQLFLGGFGLTLVGIALSGPWLTQQMTRLFVTLAKGAPSLLAARRLTDNPKAAFRSVNVLVIATFLAALIATLAPFIQPQQSSQNTDEPAIATSYFLDDYYAERGGLQSAEFEPALQKLRATPGVTAVPSYVESVQPGDTPFSKDTYFYCRDGGSSRQFALFSLCESAPPDVVVRVPASASPAMYEDGPPTMVQAAIVKKDISDLPVQSLLLVTEGQAAAEKVRTVMAQMPTVFRDRSWMMTPQEYRAQDVQVARNVKMLVNGILLVVLFVAGCSLAVTAGGGIVERKRPFGLLRVAGMSSMRQLRRVVLYESAVPLVASTVLAAGLGFLVGVLLIQSFAHPYEMAIKAPPAAFFGIVGLGISLTLVAILATMPLLNAVTKPEKARFE